MDAEFCKKLLIWSCHFYLLFCAIMYCINWLGGGLGHIWLSSEFIPGSPLRGAFGAKHNAMEWSSIGSMQGKYLNISTILLALTFIFWNTITTLELITFDYDKLFYFIMWSHLVVLRSHFHIVDNSWQHSMKWSAWHWTRYPASS